MRAMVNCILRSGLVTDIGFCNVEEFFFEKVVFEMVKCYFVDGGKCRGLKSL